jgi:hypothetical protein
MPRDDKSTFVASSEITTAPGGGGGADLKREKMPPIANYYLLQINTIE